MATTRKSKAANTEARIDQYAEELWLLLDFLTGRTIEEARLVNGIATTEEVERILRAAILKGGYRPTVDEAIPDGSLSSTPYVRELPCKSGPMAQNDLKAVNVRLRKHLVKPTR